MKRKLSAVFIALGLTLCTSSCDKETAARSDGQPSERGKSSTETEFDEETVLKDIAEEMASSLSELAGYEPYLEAVSTSDEIMETIAGWKDLSVDKTAPIYIVSLDADSLENYIDTALDGELDLSDAPKVIEQYITANVGSSISALINSRTGGTLVLAASSIVRYSKTFIPEEKVGNQLWILPCDEETAVCVTFTNTGNGVVTAGACYMVYNDEISDMILQGSGLSMEELEW